MIAWMHWSKCLQLEVGYYYCITLNVSALITGMTNMEGQGNNLGKKTVHSVTLSGSASKQNRPFHYKNNIVDLYLGQLQILRRTFMYFLSN